MVWNATANNYDITYFNAQATTITDYYPFGMQIEERSWVAPSNMYRFGFNGKESDNEVSGSGNQYDYGFRIYNPRLGKFLSVDPLTDSYPWYTPYQFASNIPIAAIDLDGLEAVIVITGVTVERGEVSKNRGEYWMYKVEVYENMTLEEYNKHKAAGTLRTPDAETVLARDAWGSESRYGKRSDERYGKNNETPPGTYWLEFNKNGYGASKKHRLKVSDKKGGDVVDGPDGTRSGIRIHRWSPHDAIGCLTTGSGTIKSEDDFISLIPSLKNKKDVRLIIEPREADYNAKKEVWQGTENKNKVDLVDVNPYATKAAWDMSTTTMSTYTAPTAPTQLIDKQAPKKYVAPPKKP